MKIIFQGGLTGTLSVLRTITQKKRPAHQSDVPNRDMFQKNISKIWRVFSRQKNVVQAPRFTTQFTTTSPRFTIKKTPKNTKPPAKTTLRHENFFSNSKLQNPPVTLDPCGLSSSSCCSAPLPPWRRPPPPHLL